MTHTLIVMNKVTSIPFRPARRRLRLGVAEAKMRLSEVLRDASAGPTVIHSRGRDVAVVVAVEDYARLTAEQGSVRGGGALFLDRVEALKVRHGGGVDNFEPGRLDLAADNPFGRRRRMKP